MKTSSAIDFRPVIEWSNKYKGYWLTAPRKVRSVVWDVLTSIQSNILDIDGGKPTEILVCANPGYETRQALYALTVATYIALMGDFESLFKVADYKKHILNIKTEINFRGVEEPSVANIEYWVDSWIVKQSLSKVKNAVNEIRCFNLNWIDERLEAITTKRNQIERDLSWLTQPRLKGKWLKQCDEAVALVKGIRDDAVIANENIESLIRQAKIFLESFEVCLGVESPVETYNRYSSAMSGIMHLQTIAKSWFDTVDSDVVQEQKRLISTLNS